MKKSHPPDCIQYTTVCLTPRTLIGNQGTRRIHTCHLQSLSLHAMFRNGRSASVQSGKAGLSFFQPRLCQKTLKQGQGCNLEARDVFQSMPFRKCYRIETTSPDRFNFQPDRLTSWNLSLEKMYQLSTAPTDTAWIERFGVIVHKYLFLNYETRGYR